MNLKINNKSRKFNYIICIKDMTIVTREFSRYKERYHKNTK